MPLPSSLACAALTIACALIGMPAWGQGARVTAKVVDRSVHAQPLHAKARSTRSRPRLQTGVARTPMPDYAPAGLCRVWHPALPLHRQPPPGNCALVGERVPPHAWLIRGPLPAPAFKPLDTIWVN